MIMSDTVKTQRGQVLSLSFTWFQEAVGGPVVDLTGTTLTIRDAHPAVLKAATLQISDASGGVTTMALTEAQAQQLEAGRANWFRLETQWPDGSNRVTPKIWIDVQ